MKSFKTENARCATDEYLILLSVLHFNRNLIRFRALGSAVIIKTAIMMIFYYYNATLEYICYGKITDK